MRYKKIILSVLLFMLIGELMIRFDEKFKLLEDNRVVKVATNLAITQEYNLIKDNAINLEGNNFRVMVLGDSYIHGAGIEFKDNFSQQLKLMLQGSNKRFDDIYVLDLSKPSSNNLDNNETYFQFTDKFKPDIVILGYNYNDVDGNLDKQRKKNGTEGSVNNHMISRENESMAKKIYDIIYQSSFVHYILTNLHTQLKTHGIVFPNSEFSLKMNAYSENKENWVKAKKLLMEIIEDTEKKGIQLIVLKFPEINLIEYPQLFTKADKSINDYFSAFPSVKYINGSDIFKNENSKNYILSKYDGHPNEKAHKKLAQTIFSYIDTNPNMKARFKK